MACILTGAGAAGFFIPNTCAIIQQTMHLAISWFAPKHRPNLSYKPTETNRQPPDVTTALSRPFDALVISYDLFTR